MTQSRNEETLENLTDDITTQLLVQDAVQTQNSPSVKERRRTLSNSPLVGSEAGEIEKIDWYLMYQLYMSKYDGICLPVDYKHLYMWRNEVQRQLQSGLSPRSKHNSFCTSQKNNGASVSTFYQKTLKKIMFFFRF